MLDTLIAFLIAGGLGALVGSDQELIKARKKNGEIIFAGIRSCVFLSTLGALSVYLGDLLGSRGLIVTLITLGVIGFVVSGYTYSCWKSGKYGLTSELAIIIVYFLGMMVMAGETQIAVILGILLTIALSSREHMKKLFTTINRDELTTTLKFAVIAFIILPLLPDTSFSLSEIFRIDVDNKLLTMKFFNPYSIWFFVVLMSGISYIGYILSRFIGAGKGIGVSGAIGGLVSSTAVTSAMADQSKKYPNIVYPFVFATLVANMIMFIRVIFVVTVFHAALLRVLFIPVGLMLLTIIGLIYYSIKKSRDTKVSHKKSENPDFKSPFQVGPALKFAGFIVGIKFFSGIALIYQDIWGPYVLYAVSFFSGFADVDAVTQDMSVKSLGGAIASGVATTAIIIAVITNTAVKIGIAKLFGGKEFGTKISQAFALISLVGILSLFLVF